MIKGIDAIRTMCPINGAIPFADYMGYMMFMADQTIDSATNVTPKVLFGVAGIPFEIEITAVTALCTDSNGAGTVTLSDEDGNAITDAIVMDTVDEVEHAANIFRNYANIRKGGNVYLTTNGAGDRGAVYVYFRALGY